MLPSRSPSVNTWASRKWTVEKVPRIVPMWPNAPWVFASDSANRALTAESASTLLNEEQPPRTSQQPKSP